MAQYKLYCIGASGNSYKVALYLNCAGLDWMPVGIDFADGVQRDADWRAEHNAMGEVPVFETAGQRMSQSGAILMWLAETTGHFAPAEEERYEALRWLLFDNHKFTNNYAIHRFQNSFMPEPAHPAVLAFMRARAESSFAIVEKSILPTGPSCWAAGQRSWISRLPATSTIRRRKPVSISRRTIPPSTHGETAWPP
jgi:glutathione S-transferase